MRHLARKAHFVRHHQHGHALLGQGAHGAQHLARQFGVERRGGLVEQHDVGLHGQRPGDGHALLLPTRQARRVVVTLGTQAHFVQQHFRAGDGFVTGHAAHHHGRFDEVLQHREVREQVEVLEHHTGLAADAAHFGLADVRAVARGIRLRQGLAFDGDEAPVDGFQVVQAAQEGALARARRPDQRHHFALPHRERDIAQHGHTPKGFVNAARFDHGLAGGSGACALIRRAWHNVSPDAESPR